MVDPSSALFKLLTGICFFVFFLLRKIIFPILCITVPTFGRTSLMSKAAKKTISFKQYPLAKTHAVMFNIWKGQHACAEVSTSGSLQRHSELKYASNQWSNLLCTGWSKISFFSTWGPFWLCQRAKYWTETRAQYTSYPTLILKTLRREM